MWGGVSCTRVTYSAHHVDLGQQVSEVLSLQCAKLKISVDFSKKATVVGQNLAQ
jgi:hypothetical protein